MVSDPFYLDPAEEDRILQAAARQRRRFDQARAQATPEQFARTVELARRAPNASNGLVQAAAATGLPDEQFDRLAEKDDGGGRSGLLAWAGEVVDFIASGADVVYEQVIKPAVRGAFTLSETASQELVQRPLTALSAAAFGDAPSFGAAYRDYGNSAGVVAAGNLLDNDPSTGFDLGTGFFAGGQAGEESEQQRTLKIGGKPATLGAAIPTTRAAGALFGHDSFAYNVVSGVSQFAVDTLADPLVLLSGGSGTLAKGSGKVLKTLGAAESTVAKVETVVSTGIQGARARAKMYDAAEAAKLLEEVRTSAGLVSGMGRTSVIPERAAEFIGNRHLLTRLAEADAYDIYQSWKKSAANDIDLGTLARLGKAKTETEVSEVLLDAIANKQVTERGFYSGLRGVRKKIADSKYGGLSPRGRIHVDDLPDAADKLDSFMRQGKVSHETRKELFNRLLDINDPAQPWETRFDRFFDVATDAMAAVGDNMKGELETIKRATNLINDDLKSMRQYGIDASGDPILVPFLKRRLDDGTGVEVIDPGPMLTSELLKDGFQLPDVTEVRRAAKRATKAEKLYTSKGWEIGSDAARWATRDLFKPLAILRPAYVVRIGLEEQARLAAAGMDSIFTHPLRFIQANILARSADTSLTGDTFEAVTEGLNAVNRRAYDVRDQSAVGGFIGRVWSQMDKNTEDRARFLKAWRHELGQLTAAREARFLAKNRGDLDSFVEWARTTEEGRGVVSRVARVNSEVNDILTSDDALREWGQAINVRLAAKSGGEVVDGVVRRLGDDDILDAIASGKIGKASLTPSSSTDAAAITNFLDGKFDLAPQKVKYDTALFDGVKDTGRLDKALDYLFDTFTSKPTNTFARYPAMRQFYIRSAGEAMDALESDTLRRELARKLDDMFTLTKAEKRELANAVTLNAGKKGVFDNLDELDEVLKVRSASLTKELLFDVTKRSNIQDAYEVAFPFFDAWAEVTRTWATIAKENPAFLLRAMQGYDSARSSGVVYANDFGEEVFAYPGGGMLSKFFAGDDSLRLEGRVQGANIVAQGVGPGFGPVVQWGVGAFLDKTEETQQLREWLAPFGTGGIEAAGDLSDPSAMFGAVMPAWARKVTNALREGKPDPVQWNSTMGDVAKVLANSGEYDPADPADQQRLIADAKKGARFVLLLRAFTQGTLLTGATATWQVKTDGETGKPVPTGWDPEADPDGVYHSLGVLANEYRRLLKHYSYDEELATTQFLDMYGVEPFYVSQAKTRAVSELPVDEQGDYWIKRHRDAAERYSSVVGYFVPPTEDAPLDYAIFRDQISRGDRQSFTAEQQVQLANQAKAKAILARVKKRVEALPSKQQTRVLAQVRATLTEQFPGWDLPVLGVDSKLNSQQKIEQLRMAVDDPSLADSPVTAPLKVYLAARDRLIGQLREQTGSPTATLARKDAAVYRDMLMQVGVTLQAKNDAFAGVWSRLLMQEVEGE